MKFDFEWNFGAWDSSRISRNKISKPLFWEILLKMPLHQLCFYSSQKNPKPQNINLYQISWIFRLISAQNRQIEQLFWVKIGQIRLFLAKTMYKITLLIWFTPFLNSLIHVLTKFLRNVVGQKCWSLSTIYGWRVYAPALYMNLGILSSMEE